MSRTADALNNPALDVDVVRARLLARSVRDTATGCLITHGSSNRRGDHVKVTLPAPNVVQVYAHRAAWRVAYGPIPVGMSILHRCDRPPCIEPTHLFLGTQRSNMADMTQKGRRRWGKSIGERHGCSKLTAAQVGAIRLRVAVGLETLTAIGQAFGVHRTTVQRIVCRDNWSHL